MTSRSGLDKYYTPAAIADEMVRVAAPTKQMRILEPAAGDGAILRALSATNNGVVKAYDVDSVAMWGCFPKARVIQDFLSAAQEDFDLCLVNPPYTHGRDLAFIKKCLECSPRVVALLRTVVLSNKRWWQEVWSKHQLTSLTMCGRISFEGPDANGNTPRSDYMICDIRRPANLRYPLDGLYPHIRRFGCHLSAIPVEIAEAAE